MCDGIWEERQVIQPTREQAMQLLTEFTQSDSLIKHALAVEAAMRAYARQFGEDEEKWGVVGLIHDFDYEQNPTWDDPRSSGGQDPAGAGAGRRRSWRQWPHTPTTWGSPGTRR